MPKPNDPKPRNVVEHPMTMNLVIELLDSLNDQELQVVKQEIGTKLEDI